MTTRNVPLLLLVAFLTCFAPEGARADTRSFDEELLSLQRDWDVANFDSADARAKTQQFESLLKRARELSARNPSRVEAQVWEGIVLSSLAGAKGGLGALSLAKQARDRLLGAITAGPDVLAGSAYTTLGVLYYKVPGFPLGFGDKKRAEELLKAALARNPDGMDPNYFYGEFLLQQGRLEEARASLQHALRAAPRPERPVADKGRRAEIDDLLAKVASKDRR